MGSAQLQGILGTEEALLGHESFPRNRTQSPRMRKGKKKKKEHVRRGKVEPNLDLASSPLEVSTLESEGKVPSDEAGFRWYPLRSPKPREFYGECVTSFQLSREEGSRNDLPSISCG